MSMPAAISQNETGQRLEALRAELSRQSLDGFLIPRSDEHNGEYIAPYAERLNWLTGFDGSAGTAIVMADGAAVFVDGRYTLQAADQVDSSLFDIRHITDEPPSEWLREQLSEGIRLGFDPKLHTERSLEGIRNVCKNAGATLEAAEKNPIDQVWRDQPAAPLTPLEIHSLDFAGETSADKRARLASELSKDGIAGAVLTALDSIAWLLNVRGQDVPNTPISLSYAILRENSDLDLFIELQKVDDATRAHLGNGVTIRPESELPDALDEFANKKVLADPTSASAWIFELLSRKQVEIVRRSDPCQLPKACKNSVELDGTRAAHRRDGASLTRFLCWFAQQAPDGTLDELTAAAKLRSFREGNDHFRGLSFDTISGAGPNGAVVHYRVNETTNRVIEVGSLYLVDSGAQYLDGTTDVTRTITVGTPTDEMRDRFTRVLKGHIAVATLRFPEGTTGSQLDILARLPLWQAGLDYDHGTGHGVGSYLGVHEGPQRISKIGNTIALKPGMIVSNEPGYYKSGEFGIRIENLVTVTDCEPPDGGEKSLLQFETLTRAPIDRNLVDPDLLNRDELDWLDWYHRTVYDDLVELVDPQTAEWLRDATSPFTG